MSKKNYDPIAEARKNPKFSEYYQDARERINFAVQIYNVRKQQHLNQTELAKRANTTQRIISNIENADINIGLGLVVKVLSALGLKLKIVDNNHDHVAPWIFNPIESMRGKCAEWESQSESTKNSVVVALDKARYS